MQVVFQRPSHKMNSFQVLGMHPDRVLLPTGLWFIWRLASMDESKAVGAVLLDVTAAFDAIDHCVLIEKLTGKYRYVFSHIPLKWTRTYLSNHVQQVFFNGNLSNTKMTSCGAQVFLHSMTLSRVEYCIMCWSFGGVNTCEIIESLSKEKKKKIT